MKRVLYVIMKAYRRKSKEIILLERTIRLRRVINNVIISYTYYTCGCIFFFSFKEMLVSNLKTITCEGRFIIGSLKFVKKKSVWNTLYFRILNRKINSMGSLRSLQKLQNLPTCRDGHN